MNPKAKGKPILSQSYLSFEQPSQKLLLTDIDNRSY